ncbi:hypothetical protein EIP86_008270 [Pleurotus ostreatoroseus]|nr:hypothetical protein EIP86_008270 [Pleurotus ostreatoroseus]
MAFKVVDSGRIQLLDRIGKGGWGVVYRARDLSFNPPKMRAVKIVLKPHPKSNRYSYLGREIASHYRANGCPGVVAIHRAFEDDKYLYIVLDYCNGGDMWRAIMDRAAFARNSGLVKLAFLQMIDAVQACHTKGIYHRDIKPNNILVSPDCTRIYLSDFGLSTQTKDSMSFGVGTMQYKSPEACGSRGLHKPYNTARADIWALGVTLINMITGRMPWKEATKRDSQYAEHLRDPDYLRRVFPISKEANFVLQRILCAEPEDCITLANLRRLIQSVRTFWMTQEEIASAGPMLKNVAKAYLYEDSELSEEGERFSSGGSSESSSGDSLEDDSDDSDEHSQGVHSHSLLAVEEGIRGVATMSVAKPKTNVAQVTSHLSPPEAPVVSGATPPNAVTGGLQASLLLAPPAIPMPAFIPSSSTDAHTSSNSRSQTGTSSTCVSSGMHQEKEQSKQQVTGMEARKGARSMQRLPKSLQRLFGIVSR